MKIKKRLWIISGFIFYLIFLSSCASLSRKGRKVRLTSNENGLEHCRFTGYVRIGFPNNLFDAHWIVRLKNAAAKKRANTIFALPPNPIAFTLKGESYYCPR